MVLTVKVLMMLMIQSLLSMAAITMVDGCLPLFFSPNLLVDIIYSLCTSFRIQLHSLPDLRGTQSLLRANTSCVF